MENHTEEIGALQALMAEWANKNGLTLTPEDLQKVQVDWNSLIRPAGRIEIEGKPYITLAELRRLAKFRGYVYSRPSVMQVPEYDNHRQATVQWEIGWSDGVIDGACADASWRTCNEGFRNFTVAIASNRAEARCIRAALGIEMCSVEEVGPQDEDLSGPANDQQKAALDMLLKRSKVAPEQATDVFGEVIAKKIVKDNTIVLNDLTHQEAITMMGALNKGKAKK
jgi:hypothetical protein